MNHPGDHITTVIAAAREVFGDLDCEIGYCDNLPEGTYGAVNFQDNGKVVVMISIELPLKAVPEIIGHELAHVYIGRGHDDDHGKEWEDAFDKVRDAYSRRLIEIDNDE